MAPNLEPVVGGIRRSAPDLREHLFRHPVRGVCQPTILLALAQEVDEVLDLGNFLGRKVAHLPKDGVPRSWEPRRRLTLPGRSLHFGIVTLCSAMWRSCGLWITERRGPSASSAQS